MFVSPESVQVVLSLPLGFGVAGLVASGYQLATEQPLSFRMLQNGVVPATFAALTLLVFAAPFIIMRNTIRGRALEKRRLDFAVLATVLACIWSVMSGTAVTVGLKAIGLLAA